MKPTDRVSYRMFRLRRERLGDDRPDLLDNCPPKPRGMRWRTYKRLVAIDEDLEERRVALILGPFLCRTG